MDQTIAEGAAMSYLTLYFILAVSSCGYYQHGDSGSAVGLGHHGNWETGPALIGI